MGIFDFFRSKPDKVSQPAEPKDERKAECPYCHKPLSKTPGRKTKCPHCGEFMFVRTRPNDNARVVVTAKEAETIDEEWSVVTGSHEAFVAEKEAFANEKKILTKRFDGKEPSDNDIKWGVLNKRLMDHAQKGNWGLYRNTRFEMAEILRRETKLKAALQTYLEVCYLDLNGPRNIGGLDDPELLREFPPFDPSNNKSPLAPGVIERIRGILKRLELTKEQLKADFIEHNSSIEKSFRLPLAPVDCWGKIESEIWG